MWTVFTDDPIQTSEIILSLSSSLTWYQERVPVADNFRHQEWTLQFCVTLGYEITENFGSPQFTTISVAQFSPLEWVYEDWKQAENMGNNGVLPPHSSQPEFIWGLLCSFSFHHMRSWTRPVCYEIITNSPGKQHLFSHQLNLESRRSKCFIHWTSIFYTFQISAVIKLFLPK